MFFLVCSHENPKESTSNLFWKRAPPTVQCQSSLIVDNSWVYLSNYAHFCSRWWIGLLLGMRGVKWMLTRSAFAITRKQIGSDMLVSILCSKICNKLQFEGKVITLISFGHRARTIFPLSVHCVTTTMQRTICSTNEPLWTCCNGNCTRDKTKNATFFGVKNYPLLRFDTYYYIIMHSLHTLNFWMFKKSVSNCLIIYSFKCKNVFIILERKLIYLFFQKLQIATEYSIWNTKIFPVWIYAV